MRQQSEISYENNKANILLLFVSEPWRGEVGASIKITVESCYSSGKSMEKTWKDFAINKIRFLQALIGADEEE